MSVIRLLSLFLILQISSISSSAQELEKLIKLSKKKTETYTANNEHNKAIFEWLNLSSLYWAQDKRKEAIKLLLLTKKVANKYSDIYHISFINTRLADYYTQIGKQIYALRKYEDNIELYQETKQYKPLLNSLLRAAQLARESNKCKRAINYLLEAKKIFLSSFKDEDKLLIIYKQLSDCYLSINDKSNYIKYDYIYKEIMLQEKDKQLKLASSFAQKVKVKLAETSRQVTVLNDSLIVYDDLIITLEEVLMAHQTTLALKESIIKKKELKLKLVKTINVSLITIVLLLLLFAIILYVLFNKIKKANIVLSKQNNKITNQNIEIEQKNKDLKTERDRFEKLDSIKAKLFSIIAHDLKSPFNSIIGFSEILSNQFHEIDEETKLQYVDIIYEQSTVTYELLENLLIWAHSQTEGYQFNPQETDIGLLIDNSIKPLKAIAEKKGVHLVNLIPVNTFAFFDKDMILIVLQNLISNAIKFTLKGGEINIYSKVNRDKPTDQFAEITVEDNGKGMNTDTLEKLFQFDQTISSKGTDGETGTGLGLGLCKDFIEKHDGTIRVESEVEKGSKFIFTLLIN